MNYRDPKLPRVGYMCGTDFDHELGNASDGNTIYPSVDALKRHNKCVDECGVVEVEVRYKRTIEQGTL